MYSASPLSLFF